MAWLCTDKNGYDFITTSKPERSRSFDGVWLVAYEDIQLPKGSIKRLIGRELTWDDEPVEFTEVVE
jgi:hypothetical protein